MCALALSLAACGDEGSGSSPGGGDTAGIDTAAEPDAGGGDGGGGDATTADTGTTDTAADTGTADAGTADTGTADTATADTGTADAGAGDAGASEDLLTELPLTITVDDTLTPQVETWPGLTEGAPARPVAAITGPGGRVSSFVANELILSYTDPAERDAFVAKWGGEVLHEVNPADKGLPDVPMMALVRVDASSANLDDFVPAARELAPEVSGDYAVSSEDALRLLTAAATEAVAGRTVGLTWIGDFGGVVDRDVAEAATSNSIGSYTPNPFAWNYLRAGSVQDIGVTEAWRALLLEKKTDNRVKLAVLDGGFAPDDDFPASYQSDSVLPLTGANDPNPASCSGGNACPYHGTDVMHTAAGQVDNGFGTAGTGGLVVDGISIVTYPDSYTSTAALVEAHDRGAQIINMSFGMTVPSILGFTIVQQEIATSSLSSKGVLLFASAGNSGDDVDSEECFELCWPGTSYCWSDCFETYWHAPCENAGVECIGGLGMNQRTRATNSNYGKEDVRLFAPYTVFVGSNPANADPIRTINGTSFSSPYVAGVAALVKAADPTLTAEEVLKLLRDTAHGSPDANVPAYVNALGAVQAALGDVRPSLRILAPTDGDSFGALGPEGLDLIATTEDYEDGIDAVTVTWESDLDGPLGAGHVRNVLFTTPGLRTITATATDSGGNVATGTVTLEIVNQPPSISISGPFWPQTVTVGVPVYVSASTWDPEAFSSLPCEAVTWEFQKANAPTWDTLGSGCSVFVTVPTADFYSLRAVATDASGAQATKTGSLMGEALPASGPPYVAIVAPTAGLSVEPAKVLALIGTAVDPDDPQGLAPLSFEWTGKVGAGAPFTIGTGPIVEWVPGDDVAGSCSPKNVELTLTVTDGGGQVTTKKVTVSVFFPPC